MLSILAPGSLALGDGEPGASELTAGDVSTGDPVNYRQVGYEPPPQEFKFVKVVRNADGPKQPEPPPPSENRWPCSSLTVKMSCIGAGIVVAIVGFAAIATTGHFWAGIGLGAAGGLVGVGGIISLGFGDS